jgi:hypothetical protein
MRAHTTTAAAPSITSTADPLARVRDREQVDLIDELDGVYDHLLGQALAGGGDGVYQLAASVKAAADYLAGMRERQNNGL